MPNDLVFIGYAGAAALAAGRRVVGAGADLGVGHEAVAVVVCDETRHDRVTTFGRPFGVGAWGAFWSGVMLQPSDALRDMHRRVRALLVAGTSGLLVVAPATGVPRVIQVAGGMSSIVLRFELRREPVDGPSPVAPAC